MTSVRAHAAPGVGRCRSKPPALCVAAVMSLFLAGCSRLTGLPEIPASVTAREAGLDALDSLASESSRLEPDRGAPLAMRPGGTRSDEAQSVSEGALRGSAQEPKDPVARARRGLELIAGGRGPEGLREMAEAFEKKPNDLVVGNAYRMAVYRLTRKALADAKERGERTPELPTFLRAEPLATLERLAVLAPGREIRLQLALAYVDRMVLNPALEIKAPASIDSERVLTEILETDPYYVPALVGRGLNELYRPRKLVWPQHPAPPPDAGSRDMAMAVAVGIKVGGAPARLKGLLLLMLGDAYAHEGRLGVARSWWVLAREITGEGGIREAIGARMGWPDVDAADKLEERLEERMKDLDDPVGDLSFFWRDAKGPS